MLLLWAMLCAGAWAVGRLRGRAIPAVFHRQTLAVSEQAVSLKEPPPGLQAAPSSGARQGTLEASAAYEKLRLPEAGPVPGAAGKIIGEGQLMEALLAMPRPAMEKLIRLVLTNAKLLDSGALGTLVHQVLAVQHPDLAFDVIRHFNDHPGSASYGAHMSVAFDLLAVHDPQAALAQWEKAKSEEPPPEWLEPRLLGAVFSAWQRSEVGQALAAAEAVPEEDERREALRGVAECLPRLFEGPRKTWTPHADHLAHRLLPGADHRYIGIMKNLAATRISVEAPEETLAWLASAGVRLGSNARLDQSLAQGWAEAVLRRQENPAPAWNWLLEHTPPGDRAAVAAEAMRYWCRLDQFHISVFPENSKMPPDLAACSEWLIARGLGPETQEAMAVLAQAWGGQYEPEAALAWARAIPDPAQREAVEARVMDELKKRFPAGWESAAEISRPEGEGR